MEEMKKYFILGVVVFVLCMVVFVLKQTPLLFGLWLSLAATLYSSLSLGKRKKRIKEKLKNENPEVQRKILKVYDEIEEAIGQVFIFAIGVYVLGLIITSWQVQDGIVEMLKTGLGISKLEVQKLFSVMILYAGYYNVRFIFSERKKLDNMSQRSDNISRKLISLFHFSSVSILLMGFVFTCLSFWGYDEYWFLPCAIVVFAGPATMYLKPVLSEMIKK